MGYAGLDIVTLTRMLRQHRLDAAVVEDDLWGDHCVVRIEDMRHPRPSALLYYENMGDEPRLARIVLADVAPTSGERIGAALRQLGDGVAPWHRLTGRRADDPEKLVPVILGFMAALRTRPG